jgi:hypothetical protein
VLWARGVHSVGGVEAFIGSRSQAIMTTGRRSPWRDLYEQATEREPPFSFELFYTSMFYTAICFVQGSVFE